MMTVTRRRVLQSFAAAGLTSILPMSGISRMAFAADSSSRPILVVLHMPGGCDGLNLISPASDPDFIAARASNLRVMADGPTPGYMLKNALDPAIDFRLHPSAGGLNELYGASQLCFIPASGLINATRSHFVASDMIERGVASDRGLAQTNSGWITRVLADEAATPQTVMRAVAASGSIATDLSECPSVMAIPDLNNGLQMTGGPHVANVLWQLYASENSEIGNSGRFALQASANIDARVPRDAQGHVQPYQVSSGVNYDAAADFARPLKTVAQLIKMDIGLEAVTMDYGDWDTHEGQPNRFQTQADRLGKGLAAFWSDIHAYQDRVIVVTLTEFGRRLRGNKSNGTDHGRASLMMVLGGKVAGGKMYGRWPGLKSEQLDEGVDLAVTTDYRQILTEILNYRASKIDKNWFPGYDYRGGVGLFA